MKLQQITNASGKTWLESLYPLVLIDNRKEARLIGRFTVNDLKEIIAVMESAL